MTQTLSYGWALNLVLAGSCIACSPGDSAPRGAAAGSDTNLANPVVTGVNTSGMSGGAQLAGSAAAAAPIGPNGNGGRPAVGGSPGNGRAGNGAATAGAGVSAGMAGAPAVHMQIPHDKTCLKPGNGDYNNPGPYKVATKEVDLGMIEASQHTGKFTIYYPDPLEASCPHPIVAWGNGTGVQGTGIYSFLNDNAASYGIVVAEAQEDNTGSGNFHKAGIDYLLKQNADPSSIFYQKLSTRAGVSGHSQGGFGATAGASHPNVETEAVEGASNVATAKVSVLVLTGTEDIVKNAESLVANAKGPMFVANWEGGDHVTTETVSGYIAGDKGSAQFSRLYAAWFRCFLGDDPVACKLFSGGAPGSCGICKDPGWHGLASSNL